MNQLLKSTDADAAHPPLRPDAILTARQVASWRNPKEYLMPATFEERGAVIPFTTPSLVNARARLNWRGRLELSIGRFSSSHGTYVVPWQTLRELMPLTVHDVMLHETVQEQKALDPQAVRQIALNVAAKGLAGPEAASAATKALASETDSKALNQVVLILGVIRQIEKATADDLLSDIRLPAGQSRIRETLVAVGERLNINAADFDQKLSELGDRTAPIGAAWSPEKGRLRRLINRLGAFKKSALAWSEERLGDAADQAKFCTAVASQTLEVVTKTLEKFDAAVKSPLAILSHWAIRAPEIERLTSRLSWLLDGWETITEIWFTAVADDDQHNVLPLIVDALPLIPKNEIDDETAGLQAELIRVSRRWFHAHEDWRTGELDIEMVHRIELMRAKSCE